MFLLYVNNSIENNKTKWLFRHLFLILRRNLTLYLSRYIWWMSYYFWNSLRPYYFECMPRMTCSQLMPRQLKFKWYFFLIWRQIYGKTMKEGKFIIYNFSVVGQKVLNSLFSNSGTIHIWHAWLCCFALEFNVLFNTTSEC